MILVDYPRPLCTRSPFISLFRLITMGNSGSSGSALAFYDNGTKPEKVQNINRFSRQKSMPKRANKPCYEAKHLYTLNGTLCLFHKCHYECPLILGITGNNGNETSCCCLLPCCHGANTTSCREGIDSSTNITWQTHRKCTACSNIW